MPGRRILIAGINYAPETTGIAPYTTGLANGLVERGHDVRVLTGVPHYPEWKIATGYGQNRTATEQIGAVTVRRLTHHVPNPPSERGRIRMEASFGARLVAANCADADVIVGITPALLSTAMLLGRTKARRKRPAFGIWIQDLYSRGVVETGAMTGRSAEAALRFEARVLREADGVVAIHDRFKSYIVDNLGVPDSSITVVRNWTHLLPYDCQDRQAVRNRLGWAADEIVVLHAGNMGAKQGLENVVEAARRVGDAATKVRLVLMGDGNQRVHLESLGHGIGALQFLRPLPDDEYRDALAAADILLVNEKSGVGEMAVPSKITSYFTTGNPVIAATDASSITAQEITTSGGGIVVPAEQPDELLTAIRALGSNPERMRTLGAAGKAFCAQKLSSDYAIDRFEEWIDDLAVRRRNEGTPTK